MGPANDGDKGVKVYCGCRMCTAGNNSVNHLAARASEVARDTPLLRVNYAHSDRYPYDDHDMIPMLLYSDHKTEIVLGTVEMGY